MLGLCWRLGQSTLMTPFWLQTGFSSRESRRAGLHPPAIPVWGQDTAGLCTLSQQHWRTNTSCNKALGGFNYPSACPQKTYLPGLAFLPLLRQWRCCAVLGRRPKCPTAWRTATYCDLPVTWHTHLPRTYKCWCNFQASDFHLRFSLSAHNQHNLIRKA